MRWFYAGFDAVIAFFPALGAWLCMKAFWRQWPALLLAFCTVSTAWIALDVYSVQQGWWSYNDKYISGHALLGLPLEEICFFFAIPLACMVVYAGIHRFIAGDIRRSVAVPGLATGIMVLCAACLWAASMGYSRTMVDCTLAIIVCALLLRTQLPYIRAFWYWNAAVVLLCLICNSFLTGLPVVLYNETFMSGWRLGFMPVEDLLYNFSFLNLFLIVAHAGGLSALEKKHASKDAYAKPYAHES